MNGQVYTAHKMDTHQLLKKQPKFDDPEYTDYKTIVRLRENPLRKVDIIQVEETREDLEAMKMNGLRKQGSQEAGVQVGGIPLYATVQPTKADGILRRMSAVVGTNGRLVNGLSSDGEEEDSDASTFRSVLYAILRRSYLFVV